MTNSSGFNIPSTSTTQQQTQPGIDTIEFYALMPYVDQLKAIKQALNPAGPELISDDAAHRALIYCQSIAIRAFTQSLKTQDHTKILTLFARQSLLNLSYEFVDEDSGILTIERLSSSINENGTVALRHNKHRESERDRYNTSEGFDKDIERPFPYGLTDPTVDFNSPIDGMCQLHGHSMQTTFILDRFEALALHVAQTAIDQGIPAELEEINFDYFPVDGFARFSINGKKLMLTCHADERGDTMTCAIAVDLHPGSLGNEDFAEEMGVLPEVERVSETPGNRGSTTIAEFCIKSSDVGSRPVNASAATDAMIDAMEKVVQWTSQRNLTLQ